MSFYSHQEFTVAASGTEAKSAEPTATFHCVQVSGTALNLQINGRMHGATTFQPLGAAVTAPGVYEISAVGLAETQYVNGSANAATVTVTGALK